MKNVHTKWRWLCDRDLKSSTLLVKFFQPGFPSWWCVQLSGHLFFQPEFSETWMNLGTLVDPHESMKHILDGTTKAGFLTGILKMKINISPIGQPQGETDSIPARTLPGNFSQSEEELWAQPNMIINLSVYTWHTLHLHAVIHWSNFNKAVKIKSTVRQSVARLSPVVRTIYQYRKSYLATKI